MYVGWVIEKKKFTTANSSGAKPFIMIKDVIFLQAYNLSI